MFSHEKLKVYNRSLEFIEFMHKNIALSNIKTNIIDQLDRAANSIPLNIAEGTGKFTGRDKCRYYDIARGSALESAACLDILVRKAIIDEKVEKEGKSIIEEIVAMLFGLIKSSSDRAYEEETDYSASANG